MDLGSYAVLSLADARKKVCELRAQVALGHDVAGEKQERKQAALAKLEAARCAVTVAQVADDYFERMILGRWKHPNIVRSRIEHDIKPHIGGLAVDAVKPLHMDAPLLPDLEPFCIHDFRRTARTHLAALGVDPYIDQFRLIG